ncbi:MAG: class I tRNA ligase family protein [Planctomycetota bacterium]
MSVDLLELERRWRRHWAENMPVSPISKPAEGSPDANATPDPAPADPVPADPAPADPVPWDLDAAETDAAETDATETDATEARDAETSTVDGDEADGTGTADESRPFFCLDMFPNPSLEGFSVNQLRGVAINDVVARYQRARGRDVFRPVGWDSFGVAVEEEARSSSVHPEAVVRDGVDKMRGQLQKFGALVHWDHELDSSDPECYRWSQWLFLKLHERGLVQYKDGWKVAITDYAESLHSGLKRLKWPSRTKTLQRNWIGRREGSRLTLKASSELYDGWEDIDVFSWRIDALAEATFVVLCPEHELLEHITDVIQTDDVRAYQESAKSLSDRERLVSRGTADGVPTGAYVLNPVTLKRMPVWVSSYVLPEIHFGAILGIPGVHEAHREFAERFGLPLSHGKSFSSRRNRRSGRRKGADGNTGSRSIQASLEARDLVESHVDWKLHDWAFERQRFWGEPIPIIECKECGRLPVPEDQLPVRLPEVETLPNVVEGESPLASHEEWLKTSCPGCQGDALRCTDTMPDWIASCWTHLRSLDPSNLKEIADPTLIEHWSPVNLCVGGIEHAELHLLYVRFVSHFLADLGITHREEPYRRLFNQGRIRAQGTIDEPDDAAGHRGPRVPADEYLERHGSDAMRLHLLFMAPPQDHVEWSEEGLRGCARFLQRTHEAILSRVGEGRFVSRNVLVAKHRLVRRVSRAIRTFGLNKAVSAFMEFVKLLRSEEVTLEEVDRQTLKTFVVLLTPFAPHMAHELWEGLGEKGDLDAEPWPEHSEELLQPSEVELAVFVNEKIVDRIHVELDTPKNHVIERALELDSVKSKTGGRPADRVVHVPDRLLKLIYSDVSPEPPESPADPPVEDPVDSSRKP